MNNHNSLKLLFLTLIISFKAFSQERNVVWVHGLNDDETFWEYYDDIFETERNINTIRNEYNTSNGIITGANGVINSMVGLPNGGPTANRNIGIGHSLGGLMLRDADRRTSNFGGIITVTTPNYGAPIANAIRDGSANNAINNACNKLIAGPQAQAYSLPWQIIPELTNVDLCNLFIKNNFIESQINAPNSIEDLETNSTAINTINNHNTSTQMISIWAEENSPVHWRLASTLRYGNDYKLVNKVNDARGIYNSMYHYNHAKAVANSFFNPFMAAVFHHKSREWKKGRDWIDNSETIYSSLIKTSRLEQQTYWIRDWIPCEQPLRMDNSDKNTLYRIDEDCGEWVYVQRTRYVTVNYPSDGLLPQYTQELQNIPTQNRYKISGANHMEVGNMSNSSQGDLTRATFNDIFDRDDYFKTLTRD